MGAYGNITCEYCNVSYYELDMHECDIEDVHRHIDDLKETIEMLTDKFNAQQICAEQYAIVMAENARLRKSNVIRRKTKISEDKSPSFNGQCEHGRPIGQNCNECGRKH